VIKNLGLIIIININKTLKIQVTTTLNESKIKELKKGIPQGFNTSILLGGQIAPISTVGAKEEWKKAQKKAKKDMISNTINKIIP
jgi:hypothetical protein